MLDLDAKADIDEIWDKPFDFQPTRFKERWGINSVSQRVEGDEIRELRNYLRNEMRVVKKRLNKNFLKQPREGL